jgi:hypothetical protein
MKGRTLSLSVVSMSFGSRVVISSNFHGGWSRFDSLKLTGIPQLPLLNAMISKPLPGNQRW